MDDENTTTKLTIKKMTAAEFRQLGLLQEVNRQFLHPLGLALEVIADENGNVERFGQVWDYRDDPEGPYFAPESSLAENKAREEYVTQLRVAHRMAREKRFGHIVQPVEDCSMPEGHDE